jgi:hypothetical protein
MGTLGKDGSNPLILNGRPESWPPFKKALHQLLDKEGYVFFYFSPTSLLINTVVIFFFPRLLPY